MSGIKRIKLTHLHGNVMVASGGIFIFFYSFFVTRYCHLSRLRLLFQLPGSSEFIVLYWNEIIMLLRMNRDEGTSVIIWSIRLRKWSYRDPMFMGSIPDEHGHFNIVYCMQATNFAYIQYWSVNAHFMSLVMHAMHLSSLCLHVLFSHSLSLWDRLRIVTQSFPSWPSSVILAASASGFISLRYR